MSEIKERMMAVFPQKPQRREPCQKCMGEGVTGETYESELSEYVLIVSVLCPFCQGCGDASHAECEPLEHIDPEDFRGDEDEDAFQDDEDEFWDAAGVSCMSCGGRKWWPQQALPEDATEDSDLLTLRTPCGCAEGIMRPVE